LALIQTYPQLSNLLPTAKSAAKFKSASSKTIKGSEPPNSNRDFLTYLLATEEIVAPACDEPVNEIP
jgi:hypothetical protein